MHSLYQLHDAARRYTNNRTTVFVVLAEYEVGGYHLSPFPKFWTNNCVYFGNFGQISFFQQFRLDFFAPIDDYCV